MFIIDNDIKHNYIRYVPIGYSDMCQHFLLSKEARTLSLGKVLRLSDAEAYDALKAIRFSGNGGEPFCAIGFRVSEVAYRNRCCACRSSTIIRHIERHIAHWPNAFAEYFSQGHMRFPKLCDFAQSQTHLYRRLQVYRQVIEELTDGHKRTHWMWFIFPQLSGLGHSAMAQWYANRHPRLSETY